MVSPLATRSLLRLDVVDSTQRVASEVLDDEGIGGVLALEQTSGRGRFGRAWHSPSGECLALSLIFREYADHKRPYLIGMALAVAAAHTFGAKVRWPNDVVFGDKKLGGILTELMPDGQGRQVPVVGIGINLNQSSFPADIESIATSCLAATGKSWTPGEAATTLLERFSAMSEISSWSDLEPLWRVLDDTPGKRYRLQDGAEGVAVEIGADGELICMINGKEQKVLAADALLGSRVS